MEVDLEKEYNILKKKYTKLPEFNEINVMFELSVFEPRFANNSLFARYLRKVCSSYVENLCNFFTNLIHPNQSFMIGMQESKFIDDKDRKMLSDVIRENMILLRWASATTLIYKEEKEIEAILKIHEQMKKNKKTLQDVFNKLKTGWETVLDEKKEKSHSYVG